MKIKLLVVMLFVLVCFWSFLVLASSFSIEQQEAYNYAFDKWITTQISIEKANMNGLLTRAAMAKIISNYAINVLWLNPDVTRECWFLDVSNSLDAQYGYWVTQACQLWLMWMWNDGETAEYFNPNWVVTRWQRATVFSRALSKANWDIVQEENPYYKNHMEYLNNKWIIRDINNPTYDSKEKRGNVMIMIMRSAYA